MGNARHVHGPVTTAKDGRFADGGLIAVQGPTAIDARTGVLVGPGSTALVTGTAATAPMTVAVAPHHWVTTRGAANGPYLGALEAATTVTIPAAPAAGTGTRIDVVYSKQQDAQPGIPTPDGTNAPLYGVVSGVAGGAKPALPVGAEELATVAVSPGATATNGANVLITNTARLTVARGAALPFRTNAEMLANAGTYICEPAVDLSTKRTLYWSGTEWVKSAGPRESLYDNANVGSSALMAADSVWRNVATVAFTAPIAADTARLAIGFGVNAASNVITEIRVTVAGVVTIIQANVNPGGANAIVPVPLDLSVPKGSVTVVIDQRVLAGANAGMGSLYMRATI